MSLIAVRSDGPSRVDPERTSPVTVKNLGTSPVFYGTEQGLSSTLKTGEITQNGSTEVSVPTYFLVEPPAKTGTNLRGVRQQSLEVTNKVVPKSIVSVREAPFNAKGDGITDDTAAFEAWLTAVSSTTVGLIPAGTYIISQPLKIPPASAIKGENSRSTVLEANGEFNLLQLGSGDITIEGLYLKCKSAQTVKGAAIDFSNGFKITAFISNVSIGSNFFNGLYMVGGTEAIGDIHLQTIKFVEPGTGVKSYGKAAVVIGSSTRRTITVYMNDISGEAATSADMPLWFDLVNCDSIQGNVGLFQNGTKGLRLGEGDVSALRTTNLNLMAFVFDTMLEYGWYMQRAVSTELTACHAQGCGTGLQLGEELDLTINGGKYYLNNSNGVWITGAANNKIDIGNATIINNNKAKSAEAKLSSGIYIEKGASGVEVTNSTIGNFKYPAGLEEQKYGIFIEKGKTKKIYVSGNRIPEKGVGTGENKEKAILNETEEPAECSVVEANQFLK